MQLHTTSTLPWYGELMFRCLVIRNPIFFQSQVGATGKDLSFVQTIYMYMAHDIEESRRYLYLSNKSFLFKASLLATRKSLGKKKTTTKIHLNHSIIVSWLRKENYDDYTSFTFRLILNIYW